MRTIASFALLFALTTLSSFAQEPVLIAGGSTPAVPVTSVATAPLDYTAPPVQMVPVVYAIPVAYAPPPGCASGLQVVSGGAYPAPGVIYVGGPNSCYKNAYQASSYQRSCTYSPNVIYFGRGEAHERGYAFRHYR
jgi:hypothetical protein